MQFDEQQKRQAILRLIEIEYAHHNWILDQLNSLLVLVENYRETGSLHIEYGFTVQALAKEYKENVEWFLRQIVSCLDAKS